MITIPTQEFFHPSSLLPSFCLLFSSNHPFPFYFLHSVSSFLLIIPSLPTYFLPSYSSFLLIIPSIPTFFLLTPLFFLSFLPFYFYFLPSIPSILPSFCLLFSSNHPFTFFLLTPVFFLSFLPFSFYFLPYALPSSFHSRVNFIYPPSTLSQEHFWNKRIKSKIKYMIQHEKLLYKWYKSKIISSEQKTTFSDEIINICEISNQCLIS